MGSGAWISEHMKGQVVSRTKPSSLTHSHSIAAPRAPPCVTDLPAVERARSWPRVGGAAIHRSSAPTSPSSRRIHVMARPPARRWPGAEEASTEHEALLLALVVCGATVAGTHTSRSAPPSWEIDPPCILPSSPGIDRGETWISAVSVDAWGRTRALL